MAHARFVQEPWNVVTDREKGHAACLSIDIRPCRVGTHNDRLNGGPEVKALPLASFHPPGSAEMVERAMRAWSSGSMEPCRSAGWAGGMVEWVDTAGWLGLSSEWLGRARIIETRPCGPMIILLGTKLCSRRA